MPVTKNHQIIRSTCLIDEFSFTDIFNDINHGHRVAILKKKILWLLPFYMAVATYFYYEKVRRTMRTAIISYLLKQKTLNKSQFSVHQYYVKETPLNRHRFFVHRTHNRNVYQKDAKLDNFWSLAYSYNVDTMSTSNKSGYWAVTFPTIYFTTSIKSELTRKIFFVPPAILLYNSTSDIAALLQNSKKFACCLIQKIC